MHIERALLLCLALLGTTAQAELVKISADSDQINLSLSAAYLVDPHNTLTIDQVSDNTNNLAWSEKSGTIPYFGFNRSNIWYRIRLLNTESHPVEKLLSLSSHIPRSVDIYRLDTSGNIETLGKNIGLVSTHENREIDHNYILTRLQLKADEEVTLFYRYQALTVSSFMLHLEDENAFWARDKRITILQSIGYGLFLNLALITFLLFVLSRDRSFLYFSIFNLVIVITKTIQTGSLHTLLPGSGSAIAAL